jgi:alkylated DNA repair dioxygenase AlkB
MTDATQLLVRRASKWPPAWQEEFQERWAIMQHDGCLSEADACLNAFYWVGHRMDRAKR